MKSVSSLIHSRKGFRIIFVRKISISVKMEQAVAVFFHNVAIIMMILVFMKLI